VHLVPSRHVISETIDGEVVMINLATGVYFSLRDTAGEIWTLLEKGAGRADIVGWLTHAYAADADAIDGAVGAFLDSLGSDCLVETVDDEEPRFDGVAPGPAAGRPPFQVPVIERFTDMQHVIGIDPIHDTDVTRGWPHQP
jgi:hypothetical protein